MTGWGGIVVEYSVAVLDSGFVQDWYVRTSELWSTCDCFPCSEHQSKVRRCGSLCFVSWLLPDRFGFATSENDSFTIGAADGCKLVFGPLMHGFTCA